jgi:hypothetical protein
LGRQVSPASLLRERDNIVVERKLVVVGTSSRGSNLRNCSRGNIVERVSDRACRRERREHEGQAIGREGQGTVLDPEMQVRRVGISAFTQPGEHLTASDLVALMYLQGVRLEVSVEREVAVTDVYDHEVPE